MMPIFRCDLDEVPSPSFRNTKGAHGFIMSTADQNSRSHSLQTMRKDHHTTEGSGVRIERRLLKAVGGSYEVDAFAHVLFPTADRATAIEATRREVNRWAHVAVLRAYH